jgi:parallel beta-helix repeat protein
MKSLNFHTTSRTISLLIGIVMVTMLLPGIVTAATDITFAYGRSSDTPLVGDWTGSGKDTIGMYRNSAFSLKNSNSAGKSDISFSYGNSGDIPLAGDWDGNGKDSIGIFRNGIFYLRNSNSKGIADLTFIFGQSGDIPVVGDWDGNGKDSVGVFRNGVFYLRNSNTGGNADLTFAFGKPGDKPVAGDWTGVGKDSVGIINGNTWYLDSNGNGIFDVSTPVVTPVSTPVVTPVSTPGISSVPSSAMYLTDFGIKGDGSDETAKLKSAFDYAASHSIKAIVFPAGKTIGINNYVETPENLEYIGNGCTIKLINNAAINHENCFLYFHAGSYVHNLIFDGNDANQGGTSTNGIMLYTNDRFENNEVKNVGAYSIYTYKGDNILINNNIVHDSRQYGIATSGEGFPTVSDYSNNITITNNIIYNCGQVGIKIRQTSNSLVKGNIITIPTSRYDDAPAGIRLYSFDGANNHITITNNQISGPGDGSIAISSDDSANSYISITNNQVTNANTGIKINFNNGIITGNSITYRSTCIANGGSGNTVSGNSCN